MTNAEREESAALRWQYAKQEAADFLVELPHAAEGAPIYIVTEGLYHRSLVCFVLSCVRLSAVVKR
jgi:hypothetical protein